MVLITYTNLGLGKVSVPLTTGSSLRFQVKLYGTDVYQFKL